MASSRHLSRVIALQTLFAYEFHGGDPEAILEYVGHAFDNTDDSSRRNDSLVFAYELLNGVLKHLKRIRKLIEKYAPEWPIEKIAPIDRAILEIAIFEMKFCEDVPDIVAIDEAIELAKTFGSDNSQKFVNGVLNGILEQEEGAQRRS